MELIQMLKALGDDTRTRIINILNHGPLCVCEIEEILNITQSNASRHLNKLMNAKLVTYYKDAKFVYYKIDEQTIENHPFIKVIMDKELSKIENLQNDYNNLKEFKNEGMTCNTIVECIKNQKNIG
ncbi:ArsR/SmtB family transcription factor [Romboutsia sp.]|uniref:ArsR/SmtB family transcription factor n=1 Tax=Romboutsia sp. TaxID=1965302 RepID=UPI003F343E14